MNVLIPNEEPGCLEDWNQRIFQNQSLLHRGLSHHLVQFLGPAREQGQEPVLVLVLVQELEQEQSPQPELL